MSALPPLTAVRAFEAVARHLSFTRAADELGMTQAAVSYQIKLLEERLGAPLFLRRPRQVALTELGARLAPEVSQAFDQLREAFAESKDRAENTLALTVIQTFATRWLAAHIGLFQLHRPDLAVRIDMSGELVDFGREEFDAGIRATHTLGPDVVGDKLLKVEFAPMLHPRLVEEYQLREPADLLKVPQITPDDPWLPAWLELAGVPNIEVKQKPFVRLGIQHLEAAAAAAGRGVAMLTPVFYQDEIAAGRLVQPFPVTGWEGHYYWLAYPPSRRNWPKIKAFREWLIAATAPLRALEQTEG